MTLCVEQNSELNTLEPAVLAVNMGCFEEFKSIVYCENDKDKRDEKSIIEFMTNNKTEWSMRVFNSTQKIHYPSYVLKAIGISDDSENVTNE